MNGWAPSVPAQGKEGAGSKYVVERLIGEGSLGAVFLATDVDLGRKVAIRYVHPKALAADVFLSDRFLRQARLAATLQSEHTVRVYGVGTLPDGVPYMVMEFLDGIDLGRMLRANGPLPVDRAVGYVRQACRALTEGHAAGIVHRGIHPDDLFITTAAGGASALKVLDYGISKRPPKRTFGGALKPSETEDKDRTPVYMSPEQLVASGNVDARTDIWAIGVVLYELLTNTLPFEGTSVQELRTAIAQRPPRALLAPKRSFPTRLQKVIERCLAKDVENRFQTAAELAEALRPFAGPAVRQRIAHGVGPLGAGETSRSAAPSPGPSSTDALREALMPADRAERSVVRTRPSEASVAGPTGAEYYPPPVRQDGPRAVGEASNVGSGVSSWPPPAGTWTSVGLLDPPLTTETALPKVAGRDRKGRLVVGGVAAVLVTAVLVVVALTGEPSSPSTPAAVSVRAAGQHATPPSLPPPLNEYATAPAMSAASEGHPARADTPVEMAVPPAPPPSSEVNLRRVPKPASSGPPKAVGGPRPADLNAVINPF